jgi:retron-type reverse transcriptase
MLSRDLAEVARSVDDPDPQGGVISPLLSNFYLTEVDRMLERAKGHEPRQVHLCRVRAFRR